MKSAGKKNPDRQGGCKDPIRQQHHLDSNRTTTVPKNSDSKDRYSVRSSPWNPSSYRPGRLGGCSASYPVARKNRVTAVLGVRSLAPGSSDGLPPKKQLDR